MALELTPIPCVATMSCGLSLTLALTADLHIFSNAMDESGAAPHGSGVCVWHARNGVRLFVANCVFGFRCEKSVHASR